MVMTGLTLHYRYIYLQMGAISGRSTPPPSGKQFDCQSWHEKGWVVWVPNMALLETHWPFGVVLPPARVPNTNVPFSAPTIQYGPVQQKRSFPGICPMRVWNTRTTFPISKYFALVPLCQSTNAFHYRYSCSKIAMLWTLSSPSSSSCCKRICSNCLPERRSRTYMCKLGT